MPMRIGIIANPNRADMGEILRHLLSWLRDRQVVPLLDQEVLGLVDGDVEPLGDMVPDLLLVLGGDGTLLGASHRVGPEGPPILGINLGGLGFLTSASMEELYPSLSQVLQGEYLIESRMGLRVEHRRGEGILMNQFCLNDAVVRKGSARTIRLHLALGGESVGQFAADGMIISTPTGSTGYSLSAGGPLLLPTMEGICVTPICAHTMAIRPLILPPEEPVILTVMSRHEDTMLTTDGLEGERLQAGDQIWVRKAEYKVDLVRPAWTSFFEVLRRKMDWGGRDEQNAD